MRICHILPCIRHVPSAIMALSAIVFPWTPAASQISSLESELLADLPYRHIGPVGNRVSAVTGVPGDANTYFFGAASGGVFRSNDGGHQWHPVFDDQSVASIGSITIAPSDANVVWVGTGETFIRSNVSIGNGIYRSTDGGDSRTGYASLCAKALFPAQQPRRIHHWDGRSPDGSGPGGLRHATERT